ncbi:hypothetical protein C8F04DRAFT_1120600 [Mycena alexandri]|uniref:F-box domain-containing protein n=1 Tax=Mycena alexandri TaxID=1745969 RepID=A0AAD6SL72_9AGAR|nr:hypothetical protein C8F04DRAFT_1120600 [Mycena alexandri]
MRFDDLRRELAQVEAALESVEPDADASPLVERKAVAKLQLDSVVYPVLTLPGEITSEIFLKCGEPEYLAGVPSARAAPLLLLRICRAWTSIALSTPALWTHMSTGTGYRNGDTLEPKGQGIDRWLGRASALPIDLYFYGAGEMWHKYVKTLLHRQASRLGTLCLVQDFDVSTLGEPVQFPILQSLTLERTSSDGLIRTFRDTPQLREVSLPAGYSIGPRKVALPWHQLTTFSAKSALIVDCLQVLRDCPLLRKCSLGSILEAEDRPVFPTVLQLRVKGLVLIRA